MLDILCRTALREQCCIRSAFCQWCLEHTCLCKHPFCIHLPECSCMSEKVKGYFLFTFPIAPFPQICKNNCMEENYCAINFPFLQRLT